MLTVCDQSCGSCTVAQNPAFCMTCATGRRLNGIGPTACLLNSNPCNGSTYYNGSSGECTGMHLYVLYIDVDYAWGVSQLGYLITLNGQDITLGVPF